MIRNLASAVCSQAVVHVMGKGATCILVCIQISQFWIHWIETAVQGCIETKVNDGGS